jgi:hypothetical protein
MRFAAASPDPEVKSLLPSPLSRSLLTSNSQTPYKWNAAPSTDERLLFLIPGEI